MRRSPVLSSNIAEVGYDSQSNILEVAFIGGAVYRYLGVPSSVHDDLLSAPSVGSFFHFHVKTAGYPVEKIENGRK